MLFPSFEFLTFFAIVLAINWYLKKWPLLWRLFLLFSSYLFYSVWSIHFLLILILVTIFNFVNGEAIYKKLFRRTDLLTLGITVNLFVLAYFKYYDFFRFPMQIFLEKIALPMDPIMFNVILPLGLSFYIFRVISYNIDIFLKKIKPSSSFLDFAIYVAFFPQLLSGPIMRAGDFLSQLKNGGAKKIDNLYQYLSLFLIGLFKKLVIVSYLTTNLIDDVFAVPENHCLVAILLTIFAYSLVIYFDFSSYSDMAIAVAGLMGFKSPINFDAPYLSLNLRDFWRRWHISLSEWVKDYIYIPLGGNRKGKMRKYLNLIIAMMIIGLWHGAAMHFIIWGGIQGIGLAITHYFQENKKKDFFCGLNQKRKNIIVNFFCWLATFSFISFSWIFFRAETTKDALQFINTLFSVETIVEPIKIYVIFMIIIGFLFFIFEKQIIKYLVSIQQKMSSPVLAGFIISIIILIFEISPDIVPSFIYFGF